MNSSRYCTGERARAVLAAAWVYHITPRRVRVDKPHGSMQSVLHYRNVNIKNEHTYMYIYYSIELAIYLRVPTWCPRIHVKRVIHRPVRKIPRVPDRVFSSPVLYHLEVPAYMSAHYLGFIGPVCL